jgi:hypothetical protein
MTYGEASTSRTAVGSGLIYHGVREVSHHDLKQALVLLFLTKQIVLSIFELMSNIFLFGIRVHALVCIL